MSFVLSQHNAEVPLHWGKLSKQLSREACAAPLMQHPEEQLLTEMRHAGLRGSKRVDGGREVGVSGQEKSRTGGGSGLGERQDQISTCSL